MARARYQFSAPLRAVSRSRRNKCAAELTMFLIKNKNHASLIKFVFSPGKKCLDSPPMCFFTQTSHSQVTLLIKMNEIPCPSKEKDINGHMHQTNVFTFIHNQLFAYQNYTIEIESVSHIAIMTYIFIYLLGQ